MGQRAEPAAPSRANTPAASLHAHRPLRVVLLGLTFVTGIVDAVTYLQIGHVFAATQTGNILLLGFALVYPNQISVIDSLISILAFLVGAVLGGRIVRVLEPTPHPWIITVLGMEGILLAVATAGALLRPTVSNDLIVACLALAMGMRNATVRRVGIPDMTTTVLTLTLTGLAADTQLPGGTPDAVGRRLGSISAMLLGAIAGALLLRVGPAAALGGAACLLLVLTLGYVATVPRPPALRA